MNEYPQVPTGWSVVERRTAGPFTTALTCAHPDGRTVVWSSRSHRKHVSRSAGRRTGQDRMLWAPHREWWWIALLFATGSTCFLVAPLPGFLRLVGPQADGMVFFVGSLLFTSAAALQCRQTADAARGTTAADRPRRALLWAPHRIDWWSASVQLVGTLFFNVTTWLALGTALSSPSYDRLVWRPDAFGSACFLVAGYLAYVEVAGGFLRRPPRSVEGGIVAVNLFGCLAFGLAAVASYVIPGTSDEVEATLAGAATSVGAAAFLFGALMLLPEGVRAPAQLPGGAPG